MTKLYHYTKLKNLESILNSGGSFYNTKGYYNQNVAGFYFTDLPPETSNTDLKAALFGLITTRTDPAVSAQAYLYLNVDGRELKKGKREHVYFLLKISPYLDFQLIECGQRLGWQIHGRPSRKIKNVTSYHQNFKDKRRFTNGKCHLQGLKRNI